MKVIILCGGKGTRLREETEFRPKPMVPIGGKPILWHIMKSYAHYQGKFSAVLKPLTALALGCGGPIHVATVPAPGRA
jgi:NDP-sugar pyrophosphorylase family protein